MVCYGVSGVVNVFVFVCVCDEMEISNVCTQTREYGILRAFFLSLGGRNG